MYEKLNISSAIPNQFVYSVWIGTVYDHRCLVAWQSFNTYDATSSVRFIIIIIIIIITVLVSCYIEVVETVRGVAVGQSKKKRIDGNRSTLVHTTLII
jgi:high-affinity K+ transport system ATPase subunit B